MPYITKEARAEIKKGREPRTVGELNYCITQLLINYCHINTKYSDFNDVVGAVELAKAEFIRRMVNPYEEGKIVENGDVYTELRE
jgi:hypothetical protein